MKKKDKERELKRILPLAWNSYQHMYDTRKESVDSGTNFLLVALSFMANISLGLFIKFQDSLFLFSLLLQLTAFVILLKKFFIKDLPVQWFEFKEMLTNIELSNFDRNLFAILKTLEDDTHRYLMETGKIIENSLYFVIISLYITFFALLGVYFGFSQLNFLFLNLLTLAALAVVGYYKRQSKFNYTASYKKYREEMDSWLKE